MNRLHLIASLCFLAIFPANDLPAQSRLDAAEPPNPADRWAKMFQRDDSGFTLFPLGEGARIILVSNTDGSDFYDGLLKPVRTLKKALSLARARISRIGFFSPAATSSKSPTSIQTSSWPAAA